MKKPILTKRDIQTLNDLNKKVKDNFEVISDIKDEIYKMKLKQLQMEYGIQVGDIVKQKNSHNLFVITYAPLFNIETETAINTFALAPLRKTLNYVDNRFSYLHDYVLDEYNLVGDKYDGIVKVYGGTKVTRNTYVCRDIFGNKLKSRKLRGGILSGEDKSCLHP